MAMQIVIVGAGTVGFELAVQLRRVGHDISLVEQDSERCEEIGEKLDVLVLQGRGSSPRILELAGLRDAEMVLAVTSIDEVNILVCGIAAQFGAPTRIARIRSAEFRERSAIVNLEGLGVTHVIDPEQIMVRVIEQIARIPEAVEVFSYHSGQIIIARHIMSEGMPVLGKRLADLLQEVGDDQFLAVALRREEGKTWIPAGDDILQVDDDVTTIFPRHSLPKYLDLLDLKRKIIRKAVVAGDGLTAIQLCQELAGWVDDVTLVSGNSEHAHRAADQLDRVEVIHGVPTDRDVLQEVNVATTDLFVGAGRETTPNIMSALLARSEGADRVIAISYEPESNRLFREIGVHHVLSPRRAMAQEIMDIIHRGRRSVELQLRDMDLESVELVAGRNSKITAAPLQKVWMPYKRQAIVGALIRNGQVSIPRGTTQVQASDELIVVVKPKHIHKIQSLFKER
jgi:trk system potassium uptake protein TrkA